GAQGTIGGGALEFQAMAVARGLAAGRRVDRVALGPGLGQCCGGAVTLVTEVYDAAALALVPGSGLFARPLDGRPMPLAVARLVDRARAQGVLAGVQILQGWLVEPLAAPARALWIWGAGHVGRALVAVLAPLPGLQITWVDTGPDRFPPDIPPGVVVRPAPDPAALVAEAPGTAEHLVLTYSHALDLELCHRLLRHGFARAGVIGSATKAARFRSRLRALGHAEAAIARLECPIGQPALGKHPQAIAIGVAAGILAAPPVRLRAETTG
ncbi:MAG: xanthine dehydrogenase accessory protein XdhC, partial [Rhodobacterales bacterium]|nr:xanthine dehydrogenase accessory protein XdhC [Rhodobacterales bacterium]